MATQRISWTSSAPTTEFNLYADRVGQSQDGNYTTVRIYIRAYNRGSTGSYFSDSGLHHGWIEDYSSDDASHSGNPFLPSGVANDSQRWSVMQEINVKHGSNGKRGAVTLHMTVKYGSNDISKTASFDDFPDIDVSPGTPSISSIGNVTSNSAIVNYRKGGGSSPTGWTVQWADNSSFSGATSKNVAIKDSNYQLTGLTHRKTYSVRVRSYNDEGTSNWSDISQFTTGYDLPSAPHSYHIDTLDQTSIRYYYAPDPNQGGGSALEFQTGYGTDPNGPQAIIESDANGVVTVGGLNRNTRYYFWSRMRNEAGWSNWSDRLDSVTLAYVPASTTPTGISATQNTVHYTFVGGDDGGAPILEWQIGYGTDPNNVQYTTGSNGDTVIGGLSPATTWYFWSRGRNQAGWGPWSVRFNIRTIAGARIVDNGVWKEAIPYINDNGVWKVAKPYAKSVGLWKSSI